MINKKSGVVKAIAQREKNYSVGMAKEGSSTEIDWYSGFGKSPCNRGDKIEFEWKLDDEEKWKNIVTVTNVEKGFVPRDIPHTFNDKPKFSSNNIPDSMVVSYAKDLVVALINKHNGEFNENVFASYMAMSLKVINSAIDYQKTRGEVNENK